MFTSPYSLFFLYSSFTLVSRLFWQRTRSRSSTKRLTGSWRQYWTSTTDSPQRIIPKPMGWTKGSIRSSHVLWQNLHKIIMNAGMRNYVLLCMHTIHLCWLVFIISVMYHAIEVMLGRKARLTYKREKPAECCQDWIRDLGLLKSDWDTLLNPIGWMLS